jgi:hypothetical protein
MKQRDIEFFNQVIKPVLIDMAIDGTLPSDMHELHHSMFSARAGAYYRDAFVIRQECEENLSHYISSDDVPGALRLLEQQAEVDGNIMADCIVTMWQPLEDRYTVNELLDLIGY